MNFPKALFRGAFLFWALFAATALAASETAEVRHVLDGDTVILRDGRHLRLLGINAPELGKDGAPDQPLAVRARDRLTQLVQHQRVTLIFEQERQDHYGRQLAHLLLRGNSIEEILLREGLAWAIAIPPNIGRLSENLAAEKEARAAKRGVWGEAAYAPTPAEQLTSSDTGFRFIEGTVNHCAQTRHVIYLDLTPRVSLLLPRKDWSKYFTGSPCALSGQHVIARGWLTGSKKRLHMSVPHPAMLTSRE